MIFWWTFLKNGQKIFNIPNQAKVAKTKYAIFHIDLDIIEPISKTLKMIKSKNCASKSHNFGGLGKV